jgi:glycosyltransferase involved in cell wall biosynthesis
MRKINIAFVIDRIDQRLGGTEKQLILLLQNLDRSRFEPYLCCLQHQGSGEGVSVDDLSVGFFAVDFKSFFSPNAYLKLLRFVLFLRSRKIDIVQTYFRDGHIAGTLAALLAGTKHVVATRRNRGYWHNYRELSVLKLLKPFVTNFLANSRDIADYVQTIERVDRNRIEIIYNAVDLDRFGSVSEKQVQSYGDQFDLLNRGPILVCIANLRPVKGLDVLLRATAELINDFPNLALLLVGDGPDRAMLDKMAQELNILRNVRFLGWQANIEGILALADLGVLSSHSEGLSNAIIEYMAAGLPVVCTDVGGNSELVEHLKNGFLVRPGDHAALAKGIREVLSRPDYVDTMSRESKKRAERMFALENHIKRMEEYYTGLVGNSG